MNGFWSAKLSFWRRFSFRAWIWRRGAVWKFERGMASAKAVSRSGSPPHSKFVVLFSMLVGGLCAQDESELPNPFVTDSTDGSIKRATAYLLAQQDPTDGSICDVDKTQTALTSLAVLGLASAGHQADYPSSEGRAMKRGITFVLRAEHQDEEGYFGSFDRSQMYGQGITCLMLGEMLGQGIDEAMDKRIRAKLKIGIELILRSQQVEKHEMAAGGWRYHPDSTDSDISVTVWLIMALRSARNAGLDVPAEAIDDALGYLRRMYDSEQDSRGNPLDLKAGFAYYGNRKHVSTATTAMGLLSLQLAGDFDSPFVRGSQAWLEQNPPFWGEDWMFYGLYYYSQASYQLGGADSIKGFKRVQQLLIPEQRPDGSWEPSSVQERDAGSVYATSLAMLALCVKNHDLPIYQR
jgi:hypothetical protein